MHWKITSRICLGLLALVALESRRADAQPSTASEIRRIDDRLGALNAQKRGLESQLRLFAGNAVQVLVGRIDERGRFQMVDANAIPADFDNNVILFSTSPERFADFLTVQWMTGVITSEQALRAMRAVSSANRSRQVQEGIRLAIRDCGLELRQVTRTIANLEAERRALVARNNPPAANNFVRVGAGVLKDARIPGNPRVGLFEIKRAGARTQLLLTFGPQLKQIGVEDSVDAANQTATYKVEVNLPVAVKGATKLRGRAKVDFRNNKVRATFEEAFDPLANRWTPADPLINALEPERTLVWGEESPSDRKVMSKGGQLLAAKGKGDAQISFDLPVRSGAVYAFELKVPGKRLCLHVVGTDGETMESKFANNDRARQIQHSFDENRTWRVRITGAGNNLPANYELEVWEYWPFKGNVPPASWAR